MCENLSAHTVQFKLLVLDGAQASLCIYWAAIRINMYFER